MSASRVDRTERLLNLVISLMAAGSPVHRSTIRERIPGYPTGDAAFERMFERDKDELRSMGIPVQTVLDAHGEVRGYRIERTLAQLPEISVTASERAVLAVAATVWDATVAQRTAILGARKVEAASEGSTLGEVDTGQDEQPNLGPRLAAHDAALIPLMSAVRRGRQVRFDYKTAGAVEVVRRRVEPWVLAADQGAWYLLGFDVDRQAPRVFRLSRVLGDIELLPSGGDHPRPSTLDADQVRSMLRPADSDGPCSATIEVTAGRAIQLRRMAEGSTDLVRDAVLTVQAMSRDELVSAICAAGPHARVREPGDIRSAVFTGLERVRDVHSASL